ncbi:hypothetical protein [Citreimonas sp.]|uniref:hypothetical protein n=1 Tax=Citreimonas sp. TaxID=3036715 RepID=UPI004057F3D3
MSDVEGTPVLRARRYVYARGSSILRSTYSDPGLTLQQPNPSTSDADGNFPPCYLIDGIYRIVIEDERGRVLSDEDGVPIDSSTTVETPIAAPSGYATVQEMLADASLSYTDAASPVAEGDTLAVTGQGYTYKVLAAGDPLFDLQTVGGVRVAVVMPLEGYAFDSFGAIGDGVADDQAAFEAMARRARRESTTSRKTVVNFRPGATYTYTDPFWATNIAGLVLNGNGCRFRNDAPQHMAANKTFMQHHGMSQQAAAKDGFLCVTSAKIATTRPGSQTVTCLVPAEAAAFVVGEWIMLGSFDQQMNGAPPNYRYFEYHKITAVDTTTGVITFGTRLKYQHREDFHYASSYTNGDGRAHIYKIEQTYRWDIDHIYNDIELIRGPHATRGSWYLVGRRVTLNRCKAGRFLSTSLGQGALNQCEHTGEWGALEVDKVSSYLEINGGSVARLSMCTGLEALKLSGGIRIHDGFDISPRRLLIENADITYGDGTIGLIPGFMPVSKLRISGGYLEQLPPVMASTMVRSVVIGAPGVSWDAGTQTLTVAGLTEDNNRRTFIMGCEVGRTVFRVEKTAEGTRPNGVGGKVREIWGGDNVAYIRLDVSGPLAAGDEIGAFCEPLSTELDDVMIGTKGQRITRNYLELTSKYFLDAHTYDGTNLNRQVVIGVPEEVVVDVIRPYTGPSTGTRTLIIRNYGPGIVGSRLDLAVDLTRPGRHVASVLGHSGWSGVNGESVGAALKGGTSQNAMIYGANLTFGTLTINNTVERPIVSVRINCADPFITT